MEYLEMSRWVWILLFVIFVHRQRHGLLLYET